MAVTRYPHLLLQSTREKTSKSTASR